MHPRPLDCVSQVSASGETRVEALAALERLRDPQLASAVKRAMADRDSKVRVAGQKLLAQPQPEQALPVLEVVVRDGTIPQRQNAIALLGGMAGDAANRVLAVWLDAMLDRKTPPEIELDLLEAAGRKASAEVVAKRDRLVQGRPADDPLAPYRETLAGGDAQRGEKLLKEEAEVSCVRCHKVRGQGGEVGPELAGVGQRHDRRCLLESIVAPNRQIAQGFETLVLATSDGQVVSGILKREDGKGLHLVLADGKMATVAKDQVEERKRGEPAMPADLIKQLSKVELRDLIEFLATVR
ncbi:MAG: c-type cytochrome [Isosphaeraceae bacterium]|nr:c-type cytochrome [Isosphaeraceae bacterium]